MKPELQRRHDNDTNAIDHSGERADSVMDRTVFPLTGGEFRQFEELLDSAPEPNEALRRFVRQRPPWDTEP